MATDVPFGLSFGNPSKYMGQSPLADIGKAAKGFGVAYGLQKLGAVDFLNNLGIKPDATGAYKFNAPAGSAAPPAAVNPKASAAPMMPPPVDNGVVVTPVSSGAPVIQMTPPPDIGNKILEGDDSWQHSSVDPQAERDSLILPQQAGYNQMLQTGNEYKQAPGFGSAKNAVMKMFGMG